jgi:hypothetical protein
MLWRTDAEADQRPVLHGEREPRHPARQRHPPWPGMRSRRASAVGQPPSPARQSLDRRVLAASRLRSRSLAARRRLSTLPPRLWRARCWPGRSVCPSAKTRLAAVAADDRSASTRAFRCRSPHLRQRRCPRARTCCVNSRCSSLRGRPDRSRRKPRTRCGGTEATLGSDRARSFEQDEWAGRPLLLLVLLARRSSLSQRPEDAQRALRAVEGDLRVGVPLAPVAAVAAPAVGVTEREAAALHASQHTTLI